VFRTMKPLLFNPGFLTNEYIRGRRQSYVPPVRLFLFFSFIFFLFFGTLVIPDLSEGFGDSVNFNVQVSTGDSKIEADRSADLKNGFDLADSVELNGMKIAAVDIDSMDFETLSKHYKLDEKNWYQRMMAKRTYKTYHDPGGAFGGSMARLSTLFLLMVPIMAAILKLLYFRRKEFYYVDHLIFTMHFHAFLFIVGCIGVFLLKSIFWMIIFGLVMLYFAVAMYKVYKQSLGKTALKYVLFMLIYGLIFITGFFVNVFVSMFIF
jgi:hypothetical protein